MTYSMRNVLYKSEHDSFGDHVDHRSACDVKIRVDEKF